MADITSEFDTLLKGREAPSTKRYDLGCTVDEFLNEAYRIVRAPSTSA